MSANTLYQRVETKGFNVGFLKRLHTFTQKTIITYKNNNNINNNYKIKTTPKLTFCLLQIDLIMAFSKTDLAIWPLILYFGGQKSDGSKLLMCSFINLRFRFPTKTTSEGFYPQFF